MKRALLAGLLALVWALPVHAAKKKSMHEQIARHAAVIGANRLAADVNDYQGRLLLRFALALTPEDELALAAAGLVEGGKKPQPTETKVTEEKLYSVIASGAEHLRQKGWPRNAKAAQLCLLYYRIVERARPNDDGVKQGLLALRNMGIDGDLEQALARTGSLEEVFAGRSPAEQREALAADKSRMRRTLAAAAAKEEEARREAEAARSAGKTASKANTQDDFREAVESFYEPYGEAAAELARSALRVKRGQQVERALRGRRAVVGWQGTIKRMAATRGGDGRLTIQLDGSNIQLRTRRASLSDAIDRTLIKKGSALYEAMAEISEGDAVSFSGEFVADPKEKRDFIRAASSTERDPMLAPEYIFRFRTVTPR